MESRNEYSAVKKASMVSMGDDNTKDDIWNGETSSASGPAQRIGPGGNEAIGEMFVQHDLGYRCKDVSMRKNTCGTKLQTDAYRRRYDTSFFQTLQSKPRGLQG